jgi:hypothetical protein
MKALIVEGRYDAVVTQLSKRLLQVIKDSYQAVSDPDGKFAGVKIYFDSKNDHDIESQTDEIYFEEVENAKIPLDFYLSLKVQWIQGLNDLIKGGDAYNETGEYASDFTPPLIEIRFQLDPEEYPNVLSEVAMELRDTLRHEIEHITQSGWNTKRGKYLPSDMAVRTAIEKQQLPAAEYFMLPKEIDANLQGLYLYSKKRRVPFKTAVNSYLDVFVKNGTLTADDKTKILDAWRLRIPALAIRQEL